MKRTIVRFGIITGICFLAVLLIVSAVCPQEEAWFANILCDRIYVFILIPLYMLMIQYLDISRLPSAAVRIGNRRRGMIIALALEYAVALLYICIWFFLLLMFTMMKFPVYKMTVVSILDSLLRYLLGLVMAADIAFMFRCSSNPFLSAMAGICPVLLCVLDVMVIHPKLLRNISKNIGFLFSWVYQEGVSGYLGAIVVLLLLHVYLLKVSVNKDIV